MSEYERIKGICLQRRELWEDPEFPAIQNSVFYCQIPPFPFGWRRAKELYGNPSFILDNCNNFDVVSGRLGDKWLLSCIGVLYQAKGLFNRVVPADQKIDSNYAGIFRFRLWWCGQWVEVLVDDRLPTVHGQLAFMHSSQTDQLWPALLEKAYAKMLGSYEALKYGNLLDGLVDLTGGITESMMISEIADNTISTLLTPTSVVTACRHLQSVTQNLTTIECGVNYRIYEVKKILTKDDSVLLLRLGKPPTSGDPPLTHLILDKAKWASILEREKKRITTYPESFWMLYSDFKHIFTKLEIVHLDSESSTAETSLEKNVKWQLNSHQGRWSKGVTAGGCRNHTSFFNINPQIQLVLSKSDVILVALNQHSIMEPKVIGFSMYKLKRSLNEPASPICFKIWKSLINSQYTNVRQISARCNLDAGVYLVVPSTFEPGQEANFSLRIYSSDSLEMTILDYAPQMLKPALIRVPAGVEVSSFSQYESQFLQLADEHKTINAFELQELLERCLPNDYIKSCATIETCRQIVLSLDKDATGRITLCDFKDLICSLKKWHLVFREHAPEKMGVLRVERLRDALKEMGFVIPEKALAFLVLKYMRKDGMLRFGDFVSAVVLLHRVFMVDDGFDMLNLKNPKTG